MKEVNDILFILSTLKEEMSLRILFNSGKALLQNSIFFFFISSYCKLECYSGNSEPPEGN